MRIKRLEIIGFKSFCDRMVLNFDEPITAIVGPNGCGKSNVVDAIRWCMGEQSAKHLRGKSMDDVIFAGSESRGPLGMCEVTLVFENDGNVPLEYLAYSEIAVTRKLYRDGTSEYFLNKTPCRLRDIIDFFLGTGVGAKAYSIIEQGRVGMIVSSKPEDRRFLIEEAAGITKFKAKKKAAEKKMEATRQNLLRVSDVVTEIEKQLASLRRQAQKAERYKAYKGELKDIELWTSAQRWIGYLCEERVAREALTSVTEAREGGQSQLVAREAELEAKRLEAAEVERNLTEMHEALYELDNRIKLGEATADHEEREARQIEERRHEAELELEQLAAQTDEAEAALARATDELAALEQVFGEQDAVLRSREETLRQRKEAMAALQARIDSTRHEVGSCKADIAREETGERNAARRRDDLQLRAGRLEEEHVRLDARGEELRLETRQIADKLDTLRQLKLDLVEEKGRAEARVAELKPHLQQGKAKLDALTGELNRKRSRRHSLEELHAKYEGFGRGTRAIMREVQRTEETASGGEPGGEAARAGRWGVRGPLADVVEAPAEFEAAVEAVLADRLSAIVVESQEAGVDAIEYLKAKGEGRATFVPLNRFGGTADEVTPPEDPGVRGRLIDHLGADEEHRGLVEHLFGGVIVVEDLVTALDLWRGGARHAYVTLGGELLTRDGVVTGGSREAQAAGVMAQKREMRELDEVIGSLSTEHATLEADHLRDQQELEALSRSLDTLRKDAHESEMQLLTNDKDLQRHREELDRAAHRLGQLGKERGELEHQASEAAREAEEAALALRTARDRLVSLEDQLSQLGRESVACLEEVDRAGEAVTGLKIEVAQAAEKRAALTGTIARLGSERVQRAERRERLERGIVDGATRVEELKGTSSARRRELVDLAEERNRRGEELTMARSAYEEERATLSGREAELKRLRGELDELLQRSTGLEVRLHDLQAGRAHLEEAMAERYRVDLRTIVHDYHLRPPVTEVEERRARELRELIDRMGEINLHAIEEYNELEQRYTFLTGQKADLERALGQLEEAIDKINRTSKERFRQVFDLVNAKFQEIFPRCFRGGQGRLVLTDEENILESGIEIVAQPPGKKNTTVEVLSGGEKAMTAVALIFAIFLIKPSPFCLLDEVDAPLDEANVGRFNDLIREMTDRSQFIVITHNKRTMQIADTLYGVTMEEPGISKLVSVNLGKIGRPPASGEERQGRIAAA